MAGGKTYPGLDFLPDALQRNAFQQLWDRVHQLETDLTTAHADLTAANATLADLSARQVVDRQNIQQALVATGKPTAQDAPPPWVIIGGGRSGSSGGGPGGNTDISWDAGQGNAGLGAAGATGHVPPSAPRTLYTVGQIVGGTANEWVTLLAPAASGADRNANLAQLLGRIIWHLQRAGFTAGKNRNPSGATGIDNFTVQVDGFTRGYDIYPYTNFGPPITPGTFYTETGRVFMLPLLPLETTYLPDGGIPD